MRLDKFICKSTELTKDEVILCVSQGRVKVNNEVILDVSTQVHENNRITLNDNRLTSRPFRYLLLHKPAGTLCSNTDGDYPSVFNLSSVQLHLEKISELHIAGRLDVDTTGLILITDDGRWTYHITRPDKECKKVYRVRLSRDICDEKACELVALFKKGIQLQGETQLTLPAVLDIVSANEVLLTITEGKYHQVKRMFAAVGNRVLRLHRERIGRIQLDVKEGQWRYLSDDEVQSFFTAA